MIIDTHSFLESSQAFGIKDSAEYFSRPEFDDTYFVIMAFRAMNNKKSVEAVKQNEKFIGCHLVFNPNTDHPCYTPHDSLEMLELLAEDSSVIGLKSWPALAWTELNDKKYFPYYSFAQEAGLAVLIHCSATGNTFSSIKMVDDVCSSFPNLKMILAHFGGLRKEYMQSAVELASSQESIYLNTTSMDPRRNRSIVSNTDFKRSHQQVRNGQNETLEIFLDAVDRIPTKILFGSDLGYYCPEDYTLWPVSELDSKKSHMILFENPFNLYKSRLDHSSRFSSLCSSRFII